MRFVAVFLFFASIGAVAQMASRPSLVPEGFSFAGTWHCDGAMGAGKRPHQANFQGALTLKDTWLELREQDIVPATGYTAIYLLGWDAAAKRWVFFDANNFGAAVYTSATGWQGNVLTLTSAPDATLANRFRYTVVDADTFTDDWEVRKAGADWIPADHLTCKRGPAS